MDYHLLAIDTTGQGCSVAVVSDQKILGTFEINNKLTHSQTLMPMIEQLLHISNINKQTLTHVALSTGPGSFTGLRIGAAAAKAIAHGLGLPIIEVATLDAMAHNLSLNKGLIVPIMDARRGQVYTAIYVGGGNTHKRLSEYLSMDIDGLIAHVKSLLAAEPAYQQAVFLGDGVAVYQDKLTDFVIAQPKDRHQQGASVGQLALKQLDQAKPYDQVALFYLRKPQAEREQSKIEIREATKADVDALYKIEVSAFTIAWSKNSLAEGIEDPQGHYVVAEKAGQVMAYVGMKQVLDEGHIMNLAVLKTHRGEGVGGKLITYLQQIAKEKGITALTLEVRTSNLPGLNLYKKMGFVVEGVRKNYYPDTKEDALIMWWRASGGENG